MINQVFLVGRLTKDIEIKKDDEGKEISNITLAVQRTLKNSEGVYETDFINITLNDGIAKNTAEYCRKGDIVGIKGRLQTNCNDKKLKMNVVAEKVTFLSQSKELDKEDKNIGI